MNFSVATQFSRFIMTAFDIKVPNRPQCVLSLSILSQTLNFSFKFFNIRVITKDYYQSIFKTSFIHWNLNTQFLPVELKKIKSGI